MDHSSIFCNSVSGGSSINESDQARPWEFHETLPFYKKTPIMSLDEIADRLGVGSVLIKDESDRFGLSSFKPLGAGYALYKMKDEIANSGKEIITATAGNHGVGVAFFGAHFGLPTTIYIPEYVTKERETFLQNLGATVVRTEMGYDETVELVKQCDPSRYQIVADTAWQGYEEIPQLIRQGYYTLFYELVEQLLKAQALDVIVFLQVGVGTFAASGLRYLTSQASKFEKLRFGIVEPEEASCLFQSAKNKTNTSVDVGKTKAGCLACGEPNPVEWEYIVDHTHVCIKTSDVDIEYGIEALKAKQIKTSYTGAITLGACISGWGQIKQYIDVDERTTIVCINTEGLN